LLADKIQEVPVRQKTSPALYHHQGHNTLLVSHIVCHTGREEKLATGSFRMMLSAVKTHQDTSRSIVGVSQTLVINQG
jgi:hypothetical protein